MTEALLDSNVLIAIVAASHERHGPSIAVLEEAGGGECAVAAHSYAESYNTLTRRGDRAPFQFSPDEAIVALESVRAVTTLLGLTPSQTFDAVRSYAKSGGLGPRLYDRLIGEVAIVHAIPTLLTWNAGHMRGLFPGLMIETPIEYCRSR